MAAGESGAAQDAAKGVGIISQAAILQSVPPAMQHSIGMNPLTQVRDYLAGVQPGEVSDEQVDALEIMLSKCWDHLAGSDQGGMRHFKLVGRVEKMTWIPPSLGFEIERHGAMANGSTRAEIQCWNVDLNRGNAELVATRKRQKLPMAERLDVKPIAAEIAASISNGREDRRIKWRGENHVRVLVSDVIPATNQWTTSSRRKRFAAELERVLGPLGWQRKPAGSHLVFERNGSCLRPGEAAP